jgi:hypothetical protein
MERRLLPLLDPINDVVSNLLAVAAKTFGLRLTPNDGLEGEFMAALELERTALGLFAGKHEVHSADMRRVAKPRLGC